MVCPCCGWSYQVDDASCRMCGTPRGCEAESRVASALAPWSPPSRYRCPPADAPSLGPAPEGRVRLRGLDLDAALPSDAEVSSSWMGTSVRLPPSRPSGDAWTIKLSIDAPIGNVGDARTALTRNEPRRRLETLRRSEKTRDGWVMVGTLSWDQRPYPVMTVRRRIGEMNVDLFSDDRDLDEDVFESIAKSLAAIPGGVTERPAPEGPAILRIAHGWGCFGGPKGDVSLFGDGTARYTGPRWRTERGALAKQDPALVAELHARLSSAPCCVDACPRAGGRAIELGVLIGDAWIHCGGHDVEERFSEIEAWVDLPAP